MSRRKVYVTGYSSRDDEKDVKKAFKKYGKIDEVSWKGRFCFLTFRESDEAERAVRKLHRSSLHGHTLVVEFAKDRGANDGSCYSCGKKGHFARDCTNKPRSSSSKSSGSDHKKKSKKRKDSSSSSSKKDESRSRSRDNSKGSSKSKSKSKSKSSSESGGK